VLCAPRLALPSLFSTHVTVSSGGRSGCRCDKSLVTVSRIATDASAIYAVHWENKGKPGGKWDFGIHISLATLESGPAERPGNVGT
jgi:hypothetical protein